MTGNSFGKMFRITTWGESHGPAVGVVIDGCPSNIELSEKDIQKELARRKPGQSNITSTRTEEDKVEILSGVFEGKTTGTPISLLIKNKDADSSSYEKIKNVFRPGHADFTYAQKYGIRDYRGGGRSSGRETAARVAAGAVAKKLLKIKKISIFAYTKQIGKIIAKNIDLNEIEHNLIRCADKKAAALMEKEITKAKQDGDSLGSIVEIIVKNCPAGLGDPVFDKLNAELAKALLSIGAVKGIEFGNGFNVVNLKGSQNNDQMSSKCFLTNNSGGILGGISTGQDIVIRIAVKAPSSIAKAQSTITTSGINIKIKVEGRHDPCLAPRIVPVAESMVALVLVDRIIMQKALQWK